MKIRDLLRGRCRALASAAAGVCAFSLTAQNAIADPIPDGALPPGVSITDLGGGMWLITGPDGSIVNYVSFDIFSNEHVTFQIDSAGRFLNRVNGDFDGTQIDGTLLANGTVYFVNPAGVFFGNGAVVNVGGIYAAAAELSDSDFLAGTDHFTNVSGDVSNRGGIAASNMVHLIGNHVENRGSIVAGEAVTMLAAGDDVLITPLTGGRVSVRLDGTVLAADLTLPGSGSPESGGQEGVLNTGLVSAGTSLTLGAGDMFSLAIRNTGTLSGTAVQMTALGGTVAHSGTISAGSFAATGDAILLESDIAADSSTFNDATYIGQSLEIRGLTGTADSIVFESTIDAYGNEDGGTGSALTLNGNLVDIDGSVGGQSRLDSLDVHGDVSFAGDVLTNNGIHLAGNATLDGVNINQRVDAGAGVLDADGDIVKIRAGHVTLAGAGGIEVAGDILHEGQLVGGDIIVEDDLTLDGAGTQRVDAGLGALDLQGDAIKTTGGMLVVGGDQGISTGAALRADGGDLRVEDAVTLTGDAEIGAAGDLVIARTIDGAFELILASGGDMELRGAIGGTTALDRIDIRVGEGGVLALDGGVIRAEGDVLLNEGVTLTAIPAVATITADGDLQIISLSGDVRMGALQKLTVLGTLEIDGADTVVLGDVNTLDDMIVSASSILLLTRAGGHVQLADGTLVLDGGLDLVAGGSFRFSVAPELQGSGSVLFMGHDAAGTLAAYQVEALRSALKLVDASGTVLDALVVASIDPGPPTSTSNLGEALSETVRPDRDRVIIRDARSSALLRELATRLGIQTRAMRPMELAAGTMGHDVLLDSPQTAIDPTVVAPAIASDRLENASLQMAVDAHRRLAGDDGRVFPGVRERLSAGWTAYRNELSVPDPDPAGFVAWLDETDRVEAAENLRSLDELIDALETLGATRAELAGAAGRILDEVASPTLTPEILRQITTAGG